MTDIDYPPSQTHTTGTARDDLQERIDDADDAVPNLESQRDALAWACDQWGDDAEITIQAFTARSRAQVLDALRTEVMGDFGPERQSNWISASAIQSAPWLEGGEDVVERCRITEELPPGLTDWVSEQLDDLNDLSEGN